MILNLYYNIMIKKPLYSAPCVELVKDITDSVLCNSAATETENFDALTDYEW